MRQARPFMEPCTSLTSFALPNLLVCATKSSIEILPLPVIHTISVSYHCEHYWLFLWMRKQVWKVK